ncbi:MAG: RluA family pseudouridine synthase [Acidobacteria bacterium]|nr:RluA family pseudouridine synthase [Acidobacteriota bacterium]
MGAQEIVPAALDGERIDRLVAMISGGSRAQVAEWIEAGVIRRNGVVVVTRSQRVVEGDRIDIDIDTTSGPVALVAEPDIPLDIVHVDDDIIVIDKQPGLVVHPGAGNATGTLVQALLARFPEIAEVGDPARPGIVHRLDKDTSGLMLVARSQAAHDELIAMLASHEIERTYLTLVWGIPESTGGLIDAPIGRSQREPTRMVVSAQGKEARTRYSVIETFAEPVPLALVECQLETGRTHQIRVHMAAIGHAVVGDDRYRGVRPAVSAPRMVLHSARLRLDHPLHPEQELSFESPLPADLVAVIDRLRNP